MTNTINSKSCSNFYSKGIFSKSAAFFAAFLPFFTAVFGQIPATINTAGTYSVTTGSGSVSFAAGQCYSVTVQAWGGGGGGGSGSGRAGGGGAGGGFAGAVMPIVAGNTYYYSIGSGGVAGTGGGNGGNGGATWFSSVSGSPSGTFVNANGGNGGNGGTSTSGAIQTATSPGGTASSDVTSPAFYTGGNGGSGMGQTDGNNGSNGAGGGGGAGAGIGGNGGNGGNGSNVSSGTCDEGAGGGGGGGGGATAAGGNGNNGSGGGGSGGGKGGNANGGGTGGNGGSNATILGAGTAGSNGGGIGAGGGGGGGGCGTDGTNAGIGGNGANGSGAIGGGGGAGGGDNARGGNGGVYGGGGGGGVSQNGGTGGNGNLTLIVAVVPIPTAVATNDGPFCTDGLITLHATGGSTYSWSSPNGYTGYGADPAPFSASTYGNGTFVYNVTVTNSGGCSSTASTTVTVNSSTPPVITSAAADNNTPCPGNNVALTAVASGASEYRWIDPIGDTISTSLTATITNIQPSQSGTYTFLARNQCSTVTSTVNVTAAGMIVTSTHTDVNCFGDATGSITVNVSGGSGPFNYLWNPATASGSNPIGLIAGTYTVTVEDLGSSCSVVKTEIIAQPVTALTATSSHTNVTCYGLGNGTVSINVTGGTAPYTLTTPLGAQTIPAGTTTIPNLTPGSYGGTVSDAKGCSVPPVTETVTEPGVQSLSLTATDNTCNGGVAGAITANFVNATGAVNYNWSPGGLLPASRTGLSAGTYSVTATDANSCTFAGTSTINEPAMPTMPVSVIDALCFGQNGSATASPAGTAAPVFYTWSYAGAGNGATASLPAGNYTVTAVDNNQCHQSATLTVAAPADIQVAPATVTPTCNGASTGSISLVVSGGTAGYTYAWSPNVSTTSSATNIAANNYVISITDANTCSKIITVPLSQPTPIVITAQITNVACFGDSSGAIRLLASGGSGGYTYELQINGSYVVSPSAQFNGLAPGSYSARVTDINGCVQTSTFTVASASEIQVSFANNTNVLCYGERSGVIRANTTGGSLPYQYSLSSGATSPTGLFNNLAAGNYTLTVTDANGCSKTFATTISQPDSITIAVNPIDTILLNLGNDIAVTVTANDPTATYEWSPSMGLACTNCSQNTIRIYNDITYVVSVSTNPNGKECTATVRIPVNVIPNYQMYVPNAFSPNNDGFNDVYEIFGNKQALKFLEFKAFNRWGEKVYETNDINFQWDGVYHGTKLNPGLYVYYLKLVFLDNHEETKYKGTITLIR